MLNESRKREAAGLEAPTAQRIVNLQTKSYQIDRQKSSVKERIGELLLYLQTPLNEAYKQNYCQVFECFEAML